MGQGPNATYQATSSWALWFWRRRLLKGFHHIWAWWPSWSWVPDPANKFSFPHPTEAPYEIRLWLAQQFWRRKSLKMVDGRTDNGRRTVDRPWLYYKLTNEPKGSGELIKALLLSLLSIKWVGGIDNMRGFAAHHHFPSTTLISSTVFNPRFSQQNIKISPLYKTRRFYGRQCTTLGNASR